MAQTPKVDRRSLHSHIANTTQARQCVDGILQQFQAVGWVQHTDTGQLDTTGFTWPGTTATSIGYLILRPDDVQQANMPLFLKLGLSSGATTDRLQITAQVGTGTNGSGTLTGQLTTGGNNVIRPNSSPSAGAMRDSYMSSGEGYLHWAFNIGGADAQGILGAILVIERTRNNSFTPTADGAVLFIQSRGGNSTMQLLPPSGSVPTESASASSWQCFINPAAACAVTTVGVNVAVWGGTYLLGAAWTTACAAYRMADIGELPVDGLGNPLPFEATHFGQQHKFYPLGDTVMGPNGTWTAIDSWAILWDS